MEGLVRSLIIPTHGRCISNGRNRDFLERSRNSNVSIEISNRKIHPFL